MRSYKEIIITYAFICFMLSVAMITPVVIIIIINLIITKLSKLFLLSFNSINIYVGVNTELTFEESTSTVRPDKLYAWIKHSHPWIQERIDNIDESIRIGNKKRGEDVDQIVSA